MLSYIPAASRRSHPRLMVETLCSQVADRGDAPALLVDLSESGLRIRAPYVPHTGRPAFQQLEFEIPGVDELLWAKTEVCFDELHQVRCVVDGYRSLFRTTGLRIAASPSRHQTLLREYVRDTWNFQNRSEQQSLMLASCYLRG